MDVNMSPDQKSNFVQRYLCLLATTSQILNKLQETVDATSVMMSELKLLRREVIGIPDEPQN